MINIRGIKPNVVKRGVLGRTYMFFGDPGTRKTTVSTKFPKTLLLATEIGYTFIPGAMPAVITSWADFIDVCEQLKAPDIREQFDTIAIDTLDLLVDMCVQYICTTNGVKSLGEIPYGNGWNLYRKELRTRLNSIPRMGYTLIYNSHANISRDENQRIISAAPALDKTATKIVEAMTDFIFFLLKEPADEDPERITVYAYNQLGSETTNKTRAPYLVPRFEFNFQNLTNSIDKAVEQLSKVTSDSQFVSEESLTESSYKEELENIEKENFEDLKNEVCKIAEEKLAGNFSSDAASLIQSVLKGTRISLATEDDKESLKILKTALLDLK